LLAKFFASKLAPTVGSWPNGLSGFNNTVRPDQSVHPEPFDRAQDKLRVAKSKEAESKDDLRQPGHTVLGKDPIAIKKG